MFTRMIKGAAAALALTGLTAAPAAADLADILSEGTISIGVPEDFPPFGSLGMSGEYEGYDVSVANMIAEALGVELELVPISSDQRIPYLETDRVDLVISSMGANPERAKSIWFSSAYAPFYSGAFAAEDLDISSVEDLSGYSVGLTGGTLEDLALTEMMGEEADIIRFGDNAATLAAYVSGQVDVLVTGNVVAASLGETNPDLSVDSKFILRNSPCFIGIKMGNMDLLQWTNVFILTNTLNGELDALSEEWFGQPLPDLPAL